MSALRTASAALAATVLLLLTACEKEPPASSAEAYEHPDRQFSCLAPQSWRIQLAEGSAHRVSFRGPATGPGSWEQTIAVYRHGPGTGLPSAESFIAAQSARGVSSLPEPTTVAGRRALAFSYETPAGSSDSDRRQTVTHRAVLILEPDGFWAIVHSWPTVVSPERSAFKTMLDSFRPAR